MLFTVSQGSLFQSYILGISYQACLFIFVLFLCSVFALLIMVTPKKLANTRCTIVFTMYQSNTKVFGPFDRICLLSNGKELFFGETLACLQVCLLFLLAKCLLCCQDMDNECLPLMNFRSCVLPCQHAKAQ
jgi:hypothetical protein